MSIQPIDTPGRWLVHCPSDPLFDYCAVAESNGWNFQPWIISGACTLVGVYLLPNLVNGLIETVDSYPNMTLYNQFGVASASLTYNSGLGYYELSAEVCIDSGFYVSGVNIDVTLTNGDSCEVGFTQVFAYGEVIPPTPAILFSSTKQTGLTFYIDGGSGTIDWKDGTVDAFDASGSPQTPSHTYSAPGSWSPEIFCEPTDVTAFTINSQTLISILNVSACVNLVQLEAHTNAGLNTVAMPFLSTATYTTLYIYATAIPTLNLSNQNNLGGDVRIHSNTALVSATFPTTSTSFSIFHFYDNTAFVGVLTISGITAIAGGINISGNTLMTGVVFGASSGLINNFNLSNNGFTSLDISPLTGWGGSIDLNDNASCTSFTFPSTSQTINRIYIYSTGATELDMSPISNFGGDFRGYSNTSLTSFTDGTSSATFSVFHLYSCSAFTGTLDLSGLTGLGGGLNFRLNDLSDITFPTSAVSVTALRMRDNQLGYVDTTGLTLASTITITMQDNAMSAAEVNEQLVEWVTTLPNVGTGTITIDGSNAAPDTTSGGFNGVAAAATIVGYGYSLTTS